MAFSKSLKILKDEFRKCTWHHLCAFLITFSAYVGYHACRKSFSSIKNIMEKSLSPLNSSMYPYDIWQKETMFQNREDANVFLGELDFLFMTGYGIGLFASGTIGDRTNLKYFITFGMVGSAATTFFYGFVSVPLRIQNKMFFRSMFVLNGLLLSTGWPILVTVIGNWFNKASSGLVFGIWACNSNIGNMIGSLIVASVIDYGYEYGMLLNSLLLFSIGVLCFTCLIPHPRDIGLATTDQSDQISKVKQRNTIDNEALELGECSGEEPAVRESVSQIHFVAKKGKAISFYQACCIPGLCSYALSYAFLKMVNYSFFFWLPLYLTQGLHWKDSISDSLSSFYDIGALSGGIIAGTVSDILTYRSPVISSMLLLAIGSVYLYQMLGITYTSNAALMVVTGFLLGGPCNIVCTAISADLGKHEKLSGSKEAMATVVGIIDGCGSIGAAVGQFLLPVIQKYGGWVWVFRFLILMLFKSVLLLTPMVYQELRHWRSNRSSK